MQAEAAANTTFAAAILKTQTTDNMFSMYHLWAANLVNTENLFDFTAFADDGVWP